MSDHEPAEAVRYTADQDAPPAGPGGTPKVVIRLSVEVEGEWVEPEMIAHAARQLGESMGARLREVAVETAKEGM